MGLSKILSRKQKQLVRQFTDTEVATLTVWFYLSAAGIGLAVYGFWHANYYSLVAGGLITIISALILNLGLTKEHTVAVASGDYPLQGAVQPQQE